MVGMHGNIGPNVNTNKADVILAVGLRFTTRVTGVIKGYAPEAQKSSTPTSTALKFNKNVKVHTNNPRRR